MKKRRESLPKGSITFPRGGEKGPFLEKRPICHIVHKKYSLLGEEERREKP